MIRIYAEIETSNPLAMSGEAMRSIGVEPVITPVRGGTDGCHLSYAGLPCPNLFTGGHNYHGKYEYIVNESMEKSVELLLALARK